MQPRHSLHTQEYCGTLGLPPAPHERHTTQHNTTHPAVVLQQRLRLCRRLAALLLATVPEPAKQTAALLLVLPLVTLDLNILLAVG